MSIANFFLLKSYDKEHDLQTNTGMSVHVYYTVIYTDVTPTTPTQAFQ